MSSSNDSAIKSLRDAVESRDLDLIESLLKNGAEPNAVDNDGWTALNYICAQPTLKDVDFKMIQLLIQYKADVNILDERGYSPIMTLYRGAKDFKLRLDVFKLLLETGADVTLVNAGSDTILHIILVNEKNPNIVEAVELLLKRGVDVNIQNKDGYSALHCAVDYYEYLEVVELLLKNGANPNAVDNSGMTALNFICLKDHIKKVHLKMIKLVIQYKADVNIPDERGYSPIMTLYRDVENYKLRWEVLKLLLEKGADVTHVNAEGDTILHIILVNERNPNVVEAVELLLKRGVDVNIQNKDGYSALHRAVGFYESLKVAELLLKNGADPNAVDNIGMTALNFICLKDRIKKVHLKMIKLLIQYNVDVNIPDHEDGESPIMTLYRDVENYKLRLEVLKLLLEKGADVTHVNAEGDTILHIILVHEKNPSIVEAVELLLNRGVDVNIQNEEGDFALHCAVVYYEYLEVVELLLKNGADPNVADAHGKTALHFISLKPVLKMVHFKMIRLLIQYNANVNREDYLGDSPIQNLFVSGNCLVSELRLRLKTFRLLLRNGAVCQRVYVFGRSMLHNTSKRDPCGQSSGVAKAIQFLLKDGVNVNILDKNGRSPLHDAIDRSRIERVEFLFRNGADPNIVDVDGNIPLNYTFERFGERADCVCCLKSLTRVQLNTFWRILELNVENDADLSHVGGDGKTILHSLIIKVSLYYSHHNNEDDKLENIWGYVYHYIEILLKHGLDVNVKDRDGFTPLNEAVSHCNYRIAKFLVEHEADVNTVKFKGGFLENKVFPSLNLATTLNLLDIIELLQGKNFKIKSDQYLTLFKYLTLCENFQTNDERFLLLFDKWIKQVNLYEPCWRHVYELGSGSVIRKFFETIILAIDDSSNCTNFNSIQLKMSLYKIIEQYLHVTKYGNMYIDIETYNYLREKLDTLVAEKPETDEDYKGYRDRKYKDLREQVDIAKDMIIGNNISFLDLCTSGPDETYRLLIKCDYESTINLNNIESSNFTSDFCILGKIRKIIQGYISKALVRRLITRVTFDSMKLLTHNILPDLCCDKIIHFLDTVDLVSVFEAVINHRS